MGRIPRWMPHRVLYWLTGLPRLSGQPLPEDFGGTAPTVTVEDLHRFTMDTRTGVVRFDDVVIDGDRHG